MGTPKKRHARVDQQRHFQVAWSLSETSKAFRPVRLDPGPASANMSREWTFTLGIVRKFKYSPTELQELPRKGPASRGELMLPSL